MTPPFRGPRQRPPWPTGTLSSDPFPDSSPDFPLPRYDHRRLTARDILVHRLMAQFMAPSPTDSHVFDEIWDRESAIASLEPPSPSPRSAARHKLLLDVQVLERLLHTTTSQLLPSQRDEPFWDEKIWGPDPNTSPPPYEPPSNPRTVGEHLLDLVLRHYFEIDDVVLRLSISRAAPPARIPEGPWPQTASRARRDERRCLEDQITSQRDYEGLAWSEPHITVMKQLRKDMAAHPRLDLYDGGILIPKLCRDLETSFRRGALRTRRAFNPEQWMYRRNFEFPPHTPRFRHPNRHALAIGLPTWQYRDQLSDVLNTPDRWAMDEWTWNDKPGPKAHRVKRKSLAFWFRNDPPSVKDIRRSRCVSEPPEGRFTDALLQLSQNPMHRFRLQYIYPRMTLSQLDSRSRRRSLSRKRIDEMFDWGSSLGLNIDKPAPDSGEPNAYKKYYCKNCTMPRCDSCIFPCGHCGAPSPHPTHKQHSYGPTQHSSTVSCDLHHHPNPHLAPDCPVPPRNRCKCIGFPTFHTAAECSVPCRGGCGNPAPPGSFKHRNAMTCRARCCMCGIRGHSGRECRLTRCRCGGEHLGQDCGWNPTCRVNGCDRFLCGVHCRECGSTEKPFVGWRCKACLGFEGAGEGAVEGEEEKRGRTRRRRRKGRPGDEAGTQGQKAPERTVEVETVAAVEPAILAVVPPTTGKEAEPEREPARQQSLFGDPRTKNPPPRAGR